MDLLVYIPTSSGPGRRLQNMVGGLDWQGTIEIFRSFPLLVDRLHRPTGRETVALFLTTTLRQLRELLTLGSFLNNFRLILILPDSQDATVALGHRLRPRFVSCRQRDFSDVALVLLKMQQAPPLLPSYSREQGPSGRKTKKLMAR